MWRDFEGSGILRCSEFHGIWHHMLVMQYIQCYRILVPSFDSAFNLLVVLMHDTQCHVVAKSSHQYSSIWNSTQHCEVVSALPKSSITCFPYY